MRLWIAVVVAFEFWTVSAYAEVRRALLSVDGLNLTATGTIRAFHIETWGVEFLAVCHLPLSWELKSEKFEDPEGLLEGEADIHGESLNKLSDMYLVDVYDFQPMPRGDPKGEFHPPSFGGWIQVGRVEAFDGRTRGKRTLKADNFRLRDAEACPTPPPASP